MIGSAAYAALLAASRGVRMHEAFLGAPGVAYDFASSAGLTQDRGGLTPVSAAAQFVGLAHDYSRAASGWVSGTELVTNGGFDSDTAWTKVNATISGGSANIAISGGYVSQDFGVANKVVRVSFEIVDTGGGVGTVVVREFSGSLGAAIATATNTLGQKTFVVPATTNILAFRTESGASANIKIDNISVREITGNPLIAPTDARRGTWAAMPNGLPCLALNGTSHAYATAAAVNPGANDEVHVWAAVRRLTDITSRLLCEMSAIADSTNGTFYVGAPTGTGQYSVLSKGVSAGASVAAASGFPQPDNAMLYVRAKIGTDTLALSRNGTQIATSSADQGTGNYTSQILNIGARNAATPSLFFNGQIARIVVLYGPITTQQKTTIDGLVMQGFAT